jgi:hypothetical protein
MDLVQLYTFPDGKLLWSKALGARRFAFAEGCPWLFGGTSFRLKGLTRYRVKKIDLATGEVLKEWKLEEPQVSGKSHIGQINALGPSSSSICVATKQETFSPELSKEERKAVTSVRFLRLDATTFDYIRRVAGAAGLPKSRSSRHSG